MIRGTRFPKTSQSHSPPLWMKSDPCRQVAPVCYKAMWLFEMWLAHVWASAGIPEIILMICSHAVCFCLSLIAFGTQQSLHTNFQHHSSKLLLFKSAILPSPCSPSPSQQVWASGQNILHLQQGKKQCAIHMFRFCTRESHCHDTENDRPSSAVSWRI